jgi:hypothetical protein
MYVLFCGSYDSLFGIRIRWGRIPAVKTDAGCGAKAPDPYSGSCPLRRIFVSNGFLFFLLGGKQILSVKMEYKNKNRKWNLSRLGCDLSL